MSSWLFHNIGHRMNSNYNSRDDVFNARGLITFDGVYRNVYENRDLLYGRDVILFVMGNYVGRDNQFDVDANPHLKLETYCTWEEICELHEKCGARIGWHTWSHRNLCELSDDEIRRELDLSMVPHWVPMERLLAYPYGNVDSRVEDIAIESGYIEAWSVTQGDGSIFRRKRQYYNW